MRKARFLGGPDSIYHCISRIVDRRFVLDDTAKDQFVDLMRRQAEFSGIEILTHCMMSNHFHILLRVPRPKPVQDKEYLRRLTVLKGHLAATREADHLKWLRTTGGDSGVAAYMARVNSRMYNLPAFMKELKQRFSQWHNRRYKRKGTLWEERYKSVLVEDTKEALLTVAHYLEMNPVRAGICAVPGAYGWNGFGAALRGDPIALQGLRITMQLLRYQTLNDRRVLETYGAELQEPSPTPGIQAERVRLKFSTENGPRVSAGLPRAALLHCRIRHFSDGVAVGSHNFLETAFAGRMDYFGPCRRTAARRIRQAGHCLLYCARDYTEGVALPNK